MKDSQAEIGQPVNHIVMLWFNDDMATDEYIDTVIEDMQELLDIEHVLAVECGKPVSSERNVVDASYHMGARILVKSAGVMNDYLMHPIHLDVGARHKPNIRKQLVYDFQ